MDDLWLDDLWLDDFLPDVGEADPFRAEPELADVEVLLRAATACVAPGRPAATAAVATTLAAPIAAVTARTRADPRALAVMARSMPAPLSGLLMSTVLLAVDSPSMAGEAVGRLCRTSDRALSGRTWRDVPGRRRSHAGSAWMRGLCLDAG